VALRRIVSRYALRFFVFVLGFSWMKIRSVRHRGLRQFIFHDDPAGLPQQHVEKIRRIVSFLQDMGTEDELSGRPSVEGASSDGRPGWSLEPFRLA
jgi:hypothetical protein